MTTAEIVDREALEHRIDELAFRALIDPAAEVELSEAERQRALLDRPAAAERGRADADERERERKRHAEVQRRLRPLQTAAKRCVEAARAVEQSPHSPARAELLQLWDATFAKEYSKLGLTIGFDLRDRIGPRLSYLDGHAPDALRRREAREPLDQKMEQIVDGRLQAAESRLGANGR